MKSKIAAVVVTLVLGAAACGGERSPATSTLQPNGNAVLNVHNDHWLDVTVYAVSSGTRHRLGTVPGLKTVALPVHNTIVAGAGTIRLLIEPIGSAAAHLTEPVMLSTSDVIELHVRDPLNLTFFTVGRPER
jgi:hypothetical protein